MVIDLVVRFVIGRAEEVAEEEQLVFLDGAAHRAAEVVVGDVAHTGVEVGARIHVVVLHVFGQPGRGNWLVPDLRITLVTVPTARPSSGS